MVRGHLLQTLDIMFLQGEATDAAGAHHHHRIHELQLVFLSFELSKLHCIAARGPPTAAL